MAAKDDNYRPWHIRLNKALAKIDNNISVVWPIDEKKLTEFSDQYITNVMNMGLAVTSLQVTWVNGAFHASVKGKPLKKKVQE